MKEIKFNKNNLFVDCNDIEASGVVDGQFYVLKFDANSRIYTMTIPNTVSGLFQGVIDCSGTPNYPASYKDWYYRVSVAGKIGGSSGHIVEVGDEIICIADSAGGTEATVGTQFMIVNKDITACTVAILRTGTSVVDYLTPKTFTDQAIVFGANVGIEVQTKVTGFLCSGVQTTGIEIASATNYGINISGLSATAAIQIGATSGTSINIGGSSVTAIAINASCTTGIVVNFGSTVGISVASTSITGIGVSGACTTGISISGADSVSLSIRGTLALTTGRAITSITTIQNAALGDG
jgi:hypothetical protein